MDEWRLISLGIFDGYMNMALDEAILMSVIEKKSSNTLRFYKWKPSTATIGRNQSLSKEIDLKAAKENGFQVIRRITGGGAVFHDEFREITYSLTCPIKFLEDLGSKKVIEQFEIITQGIIRGLRIYGLKPEKGIIHCPAIFLDGKKFSGNAQTRKKGIILQHGTIILELDPDLMYSILTPPKSVSKSRMVQSVYAKCIGVKDYLENYEEDKFIASLKQGFEQALHVSFKDEDFSDLELKNAEILKVERYMKESWLKKYE